MVRCNIGNCAYARAGCNLCELPVACASCVLKPMRADVLFQVHREFTVERCTTVVLLLTLP
jgi:hypothetical protein